MRPGTATLLLLLAATTLHAGGAREKPGDARFDVSDRVEELRLPISARPVTISLWTPLPPAAGVRDLSDLLIYREAFRRTGVTVRFVHPAPGRERAELATLVAAADPPDMIEIDWTQVPGGPSRAIAEGLIIPLNEVTQTWMPNYRALLARWPARARALRTDEGHTYGFPVLAWSAADPELALAIGATAGLQARGDVLERLKVARLETLDDWDAALRLVKKEPGMETPLLLRATSLAQTHLFASAHAASFGFYQSDGRVKYGPLEPGFRDFLALLAAWVKDGLVNADLGTVDAASHDSRIVEGKAAAWIGTSDGMVRLAAALKAREPAATVVALPPPAKKTGESALLGANDAWTGIGGNRVLTFTTKNQKLKVSALWVDFWYSDEGRLLQHYGIQGETYRLAADGRPELTAAGRTRRFNGGFTLFSHFDLEAWRGRSSALAEAARLWARAATPEHALPPLSPMGREAALEAEILPKAGALVEEMTVKIAIGAEPLERFEDTTKQLEGLGMRELLAAKQAQLDRYLRR